MTSRSEETAASTLEGNKTAVVVYKAPSAEERFAAFLLDLQKEVAWFTKHVMTGLTLKDQGDHWLLVLRAHNGGVAKVAFFAGHDRVECYRQLWRALHTHGVEWKIDRFHK